MKLRYRQMRIDDLPATFAVRLATVENTVTMNQLENEYHITERSLAEAMKTNVKGWLCQEADKVVGFSMGDSASGEVLVVAVLPEYEGNGIGKTLMNHVQDWLFSEGYDEIWLLASPDAETRAYGFYHKLGWRATGKMIGNDEIWKLIPTLYKSRRDEMS